MSKQTNVPSPRQIQCIQYLSCGLSYEETGRILGIKKSTVDQHVTRFRKKSRTVRTAQDKFWLIENGQHPAQVWTKEEQDKVSAFISSTKSKHAEKKYVPVSETVVHVWESRGRGYES